MKQMKTVVVVLLVATGFGTGCNKKDQACKAARVDAAKVVADEDPELELQTAKFELKQLEIARAEQALRRKAYAGILKGFDEALGCSTDDACCMTFVKKSRDERIATTELLASMDHWEKTPAALGAAETQLGNAILRFGDDVRTENTRDTIRTCVEIRADVAAIAQNQAAWTDEQQELDDKIADAKAAVAGATARRELRGAWADALHDAKPVVVAEDAGEPKAPEDFRTARKAMIKYADSCR